ncbi:hypothetical protein GQX74_001790 [Glossina fuscipes]|nr:hypothetical protein GQX74_001790 [Glossina fuscipes]
MPIRRDHRPTEILQCQCYNSRPKDPDENNCDEYATIRHGAMSTLPIRDCLNRRRKPTRKLSFAWIGTELNSSSSSINGVNKHNIIVFVLKGDKRIDEHALEEHTKAIKV